MNELFKDLFIFEMANNHQGSLEHGLRIVEEMAKIRDEYRINAAIKFQYRELDSFIHKDYKNREDVKHIPRFLSTKLNEADFDRMVERSKELSLRSMSTPFDEASVDKCVDRELDIIKIASCSADDWPLIEKVAAAKKPVIVSTGGLSIQSIDSLVSFFGHKGVDFALLHCVALYPSPNDSLNLNYIDRLRRRYPEIPVGFSGHEAPENNDVVKIAVSKSAMILERHIGVPTDTIKLNAYSMNPDQTRKWIEAALNAKTICGGYDKVVTDEERDSLLSLKRGVFANVKIRKGEIITREKVYFAMPCGTGQTTSGELGRYRVTLTASKDYSPDEAICERVDSEDTIGMIRGYIHEAKGMLYEAGARFTDEATVELSHHYGIARFREYGALIVNVINREYCKKLIVMFPGQQHPDHLHKRKEETFQLLWGDLSVVLGDRTCNMKPGETLLIERGASHKFSSSGGAVFEEVSTTHFKNDSFYEDDSIARLDLIERKTLVENW